MDSNPFIRKLRNGASLTAADEAALIRLMSARRHIPSQTDIVLEHQEPHALILILEGWGCRYKQLENGKRQIISFFLPGDLCQPYGLLPNFMDHSLGTLTSLTFSTISPELIRGAAQASPTIEEALWWDMLSTTAMLHERIVSLGRRSAVERMGHLMCELHHRLTMVGLADPGGFELPVRQYDLADLLGLSTVHVNRSLADLRAAGLISQHGRRVLIPDIAELQTFSFFDETFLHIKSSE
jgi:CRP-like cAMP-binding protein